MSTYLQLCEKYRKRSGVTSSAIAAVTSQVGMSEKITIWIADADEEIQGLYSDWGFLKDTKIITLTLAAGATYTLSTLAMTNMNMWDRENFYINPGAANYSKLSEMPYREWLRSSARLGTTVTAQPSRFVVKPDDSLVFVDAPNATYTVWADYFKKPTRLSTNTQESSIPSNYEDVIIYRAMMFHGQYYEDASLYNTAEKDYQRELSKLEAKFLPDREELSKAANNPETFRIVAG